LFRLGYKFDEKQLRGNHGIIVEHVAMTMIYLFSIFLEKYFQSFADHIA
jgi:hypothetical protein